MQIEPPQDGEATPHWRPPRRIRVALTLAAAVALVALLLLVLRSTLPQAGSAQAGTPRMLYSYQDESSHFDGPTPSAQYPRPGAYPGALLTATFTAVPVRPLRPDEHPAPIVVEALVFGPFASDQAIEQFSVAERQLRSQLYQGTPVSTPGAGGQTPPDPWPIPPVVRAQQTAASDSGQPVTLRLTLPQTLPAGLYLYVTQTLPGDTAGGAAAFYVLAGPTTPT